MSKYHLKTIRDTFAVVFSVIFIILVFNKGCNGQTTGFNGVNFFQYSTPADWDAIVNASGDTISFRYRFDKQYNNDRDKLIQFDSIARANGKDIWLTLTSDMNAANTAAEIGYLESHGVNVDVLELGNEEYSETTPKLSFAAYQALIDPIIAATSQYDLIYTLCAPPRPLNSGVQGGRRDHQTWHDALQAYLSDKGDNYGINWHIYYNNRECPVLASKPAKRAYNGGVYADLQTYYSDLLTQATASDLWSKSLAYINEFYGGRYVSISEFGAVAEGDGETSGGAGSIKNTLVYAEIMFRAWNLYRCEVNTMDIHSGVALTGMITPSGKFDLFSGNQKRVEFYAYQLVNEIPTCPELSDEIIYNEGVYYRWFTSDYLPEIYGDNVSLEFETHYVEGLYPYSTAGYAEWMGTGTIKNKEIQGINVVDGIYIPANGFGYVKITAESLCYDTTYTVIDTTYEEVLNYEWTKCQRPFWRIFRAGYCSTQPQFIRVPVYTERQVTETICN